MSIISLSSPRFNLSERLYLILGSFALGVSVSVVYVQVWVGKVGVDFKGLNFNEGPGTETKSGLRTLENVDDRHRSLFYV